MIDKPYHRRLSEDELIDKIVITKVPRYKSSGLSGDEWRTSALVEFYTKGNLVGSTGFRDVDTALQLTYAHTVFAGEKGAFDKAHCFKHNTCDQPGCYESATVYYGIKELFSAQGEKLDPKDSTLKYYRQFCDKHKHRGDCDREDCDSNYEPIACPQ